MSTDSLFHHTTVSPHPFFRVPDEFHPNILLGRGTGIPRDMNDNQTDKNPSIHGTGVPVIPPMTQLEHQTHTQVQVGQHDPFSTQYNPYLQQQQLQQLHQQQQQQQQQQLQQQPAQMLRHKSVKRLLGRVCADGWPGHGLGHGLRHAHSQSQCENLMIDDEEANLPPAKRHLSQNLASRLAALDLLSQTQQPHQQHQQQQQLDSFSWTHQRNEPCWIDDDDESQQDKQQSPNNENGDLSKALVLYQEPAIIPTQNTEIVQKLMHTLARPGLDKWHHSYKLATQDKLREVVFKSGENERQRAKGCAWQIIPYSGGIITPDSVAIINPNEKHDSQADDMEC